MSKQIKKQFLTISEIAKITGASRTQVYRQVYDGKWGKVYKLGCLKIKRSEFEKRLENFVDETIKPEPIR